MDNKTIRLAIQSKGRLNEDSLRLLKDAFHLSRLLGEHDALLFAPLVGKDPLDESISRIFSPPPRTIRFRLREHHFGLDIQKFCREHEKFR